MSNLTPKEKFLRSRGLDTRDMSLDELKKKKEIVSKLKKQMPYFKKKYGERANEIMNRIAIKKAKTSTIKNEKKSTIKDSYKTLITNMLNEEKHKISIEDFQKLAVQLSELSPKELDKTVKVSNGDHITPRDIIHHHSNMLYRTLDDKTSPDKHVKALTYQKVNVDALLKHFRAKIKED